MKRWQLVPVKKLFCPRMIRIIGTRPTPALPDLGTSFIKNSFVRRIFPKN